MKFTLPMINNRYPVMAALTIVLSACGGQAVTSSSAVQESTSSVSSSVAPSSSSSIAQSSSASSVSLVETLMQEGSQFLCPFVGIVESEHTGFIGDGYANGSNVNGNQLIYAINVPSSASYELEVRYANGSAAARAAILKTSSGEANLSFQAGTDWADWQTLSTTVTLPAGDSQFILQANDDAGLPNIDYVKFTGGDEITAATCPEYDPITIWLAGDSTVANGQTPCPVGWGKVLYEFFNDKVVVQNYAAGGRSVRTWLYDITSTMEANGECGVNRDGSGQPIQQQRWIDMQAQMQAGDYLFIQFGINDGSPTCPRHVGEQALKSEYRMMAQFALDRGAHPVFFTPSPALRCSGSTAVGSRGFINVTNEIANEMNVPLIDLHQLGTDLYNQKGFCPVAGGDVSASTTGAVGDFFCDDHTHFDTPGAREMSQLIVNELVAKYSALANYLK